MPSYATAADVKDNDIGRLTDQGGWIESDINERIDEGEAFLDACLVQLGYDISTFGASTPPLVKRLTILYGRYAVLRDLFKNRGQKKDVEQGERYKKPFDDMLQKLKDNELALVDVSGNIIKATSSVNSRIAFTGDGVNRALTMADPEDQILDEEYANKDITGDPDAS